MGSFEAQSRYFDSRMAIVPYFTGRFPDGIDLKRQRVLDLGCGHGAFACYAARQGAKEVVGVDIDDELIQFAQENQRLRYCDTEGTLRFENRNIFDGGLTDFDIVLSEATFEHIQELDKVLAQVSDMLRVGGKLYTGYAPLYNAPWGDHGRFKVPFQKIPWMHLAFPKTWLFKRISRIEGRRIEKFGDLGLNGLSFAEHKRILSASSMETIFFEVNNQSRPSVWLINLLRRLPVLHEMLAISIFAILQKNASEF